VSSENHSTMDDPRVERLYMLAHAFLEHGDTPGCIEAYQQALALAYDSPSLHAGLAAVLEGTGDLNGALREYSKAQQLNPKNPHYVKALDNLRQRIGSTSTRPLSGALTVPLNGKLPPPPQPIPAALVAVARAVRSSEVSPEDRGWVIAALRVALKSEPENERLHVKLSNLLQAEGDRNGAAEHMREANRLSRLRMRRQA
jgi:tetratricopeptide (TPR) repeat protein